MFVVNRALVALVLISSVYGNTRGHHKTKNVGIIGGHYITIEKVPYIVSLRLNGTYHWCGGSIIHERFILTAAHCIKPNREYKVRVGSDNIDEGGKMYDVKKILTHEMYSPNNNYDYDMCILKLNESLTFGPKVNKIELNGDVKLKPSTMLNTTGWGSTHQDGRSMSKHLKQVSIPVVSRLSCMLIYRRLCQITQRMLCVGGHGRDSCSGDSGGPLTWNNVQIGVTSFGSGCGTNPGVYMKLSKFRTWIKKTIEENL